MSFFDFLFGRPTPPAAPPLARMPAGMRDHRAMPSDSAKAAKERLQIVIARERADVKRAEFMPKLQHDLLEVIRRYFEIDDKKMQVQLQNDDQRQVLEINVELPPPTLAAARGVVPVPAPA